MMSKFSLENCPRNEQGHYLCQTRDGRPARVVCVDAATEENGTRLIAVVRRPDTCGDEVLLCLPDGKFAHSGETRFDLVNLPVKREGWINIYPSPVSISGRLASWLFDTEADADKHASDLRIGPAIKIEWEE